MTDNKRAIGLGAAGILGMVVIGGARIADDLARVGAHSARLADEAVDIGRVAGAADELSLGRHIDGGTVLDGIEVGEMAVDIGELLAELGPDGEPLSLSTEPFPSGVWQSRLAPENLPFLWSCEDTAPGGVRTCALSFEENDTLSLRFGLGSVFFAESGETTLLCWKIHQISEPLPDRTLSETLLHLNTDACHEVIERSPTRLRLRDSKSREYTFSQRS
jgi:hypothetical protein